MKERLYANTLMRLNEGCPPVWYMRQAGRYHSHYQKLRSRFGFIDMCKVPELACEVTMGPIEDFDYDAAILFSDILFPLESLGIPLSYDPAPKLGFHLSTTADVARLRKDACAQHEMKFQADALKLIRRRLPTGKGLIGFVGAPLTLYVFAVDGSHKSGLESSRQGLRDGRFDKFMTIMLPFLLENMCVQAEAGLDAIAIFDTSAGDFAQKDFQHYAAPVLTSLIREFRKRHPYTKVIYYSKNTDASYWDLLEDAPIDCLGIDWHHNIAKVLDRYGERYAIQGNIDPNWLRDDTAPVLAEKLKVFFAHAKRVPLQKRKGWVCGLGHGVLPMTPEENVRLSIRLLRESFK